MKLNQLTFTRFLAALAIVVYHAKSAIWPFNTNVLYPLFSKANIGVSYFFILSGFVMIIAYGSRGQRRVDAGEYYLNRLARIYPVYLLALVMMAAIEYKIMDTRSLSASLFALQAWIPGYALTLNSPAWSISVEFLFYLVFPVLFNYLYQRSRLAVIAPLTLAFWVLTQVLLNKLYFSGFYEGYPSNSHDLLFYFPPMHLNEFLVGNLTGLIYLRLYKEGRARNYDWAVLLLAILSIGLIALDIPVNLHDGMMAIVFAPFILLLALNTGRISKGMSGRIPVLLGEASYSLYILQVPLHILCLFVFKRLGLVNPNIQFYSYLVFLILASVASYYTIELPARKWIRSIPTYFITAKT
ncbi:MAG: acyltransferase [Bacteroidetes bacterium]|nr:acyltransferase [Bacteroidota bacterium]